MATHPFLKFAILPALALTALVPMYWIQRRWLRITAMAFAAFVAVVSTCQLLASLSTGSIDISDLWLLSPYPWLLSLPLVGIWASFHDRIRWRRISALTISSLILVPSGLVAFFFCVSESGCTIHEPPVYAPDGKHVALVEFVHQGALGSDGATISVRRDWSPFADRVYSGFAEWYPSGAASPEARWIDNDHLLIRYWTEGTNAASCLERTEPVRITCEKTNAEMRKPDTARLLPSLPVRQP